MSKAVQTKSPRRIGAENSKTRAALLDAAQELMREEGYAAVTSRMLAGRAGLKPQLVHYYFHSMDDLFLALFERVASELLRKQDMLVDCDKPVGKMWELGNNTADAVLYVEFMAMANHRKSLRAAIAEFGDTARKRQTDRLIALIESRDLDDGDWKPVALATILETVSRSLSFEELLGMSEGREETLTAIRQLIDRLDNAPLKAPIKTAAKAPAKSARKTVPKAPPVPAAKPPARKRSAAKSAS